MQTKISHSHAIQLGQQLGQGGEATVFNVTNQPNMVAKLYHHPSPAHAIKLQAMVANPPEQSSTHIAIAWPISLLYKTKTGRLKSKAYTNPSPLSTNQQFVGFLMPKVTTNISLFQVYNPIMRANLPYRFSERALYRTAYNLCAVVAALHNKGYVLGDINESNILVNHQALVTVVDTDSFQVIDANEVVHRCPVGKPEYTPPELQGVDFKTINQGVEHDLFGLAVLLFQLLMNGFHPFAGVLRNQQSVGRVDLYAIRKGFFSYADSTYITPPPAAPTFQMLPPDLQTAFKRCFINGHQQPFLRPLAHDWMGYLKTAEENLTTCQSGRHVYSNHHLVCPKCHQQRFEPIKHIFKPSSINQDLLRLMAQGIQSYEERDVQAVFRAMTQVIAYENPPAEAYAYRAWAYYQRKDYQKAISHTEITLAQEPNNALAHYILGASYNQQGHYQQAEVALTEAINLKYEPIAEAYYERALAHRNMANTKAAIEDVNQQLQTEQDKIRRIQGKKLQQELSQVNYQTKVIQTSLNPITNLMKIALWATLMIFSIVIATGSGTVVYENIQLSINHESTVATVFNRTISTQNKGIKSYRLYYEYPVKQLTGATKTYRDYDTVPLSQYNQNPKTVEIIYVPQNPTNSAIANLFNPTTDIMLSGGFSLLFIGVGLGGFYLAGQYLAGLWYVFELWVSGKSIQGKISRMTIRSWINKGNKHYAYDIWYQYGDGFVAKCEISQVAYLRLNQGDTIEVYYLPDKPYISQPHPLHEYMGRF